MPAGTLKRTGFSARGEKPREIRLIGTDELSPVRFEAQKRRRARLFSAISIL
jgi:hypothetical protein